MGLMKPLRQAIYTEVWCHRLCYYHKHVPLWVKDIMNSGCVPNDRTICFKGIPKWEKKWENKEALKYTEQIVKDPKNIYRSMIGLSSFWLLFTGRLRKPWIQTVSVWKGGSGGCYRTTLWISTRWSGRTHWQWTMPLNIVKRLIARTRQYLQILCHSESKWCFTSSMICI